MKTKIKQTDYAYFAGYIDGDGCFSIGRICIKKYIKSIVAIEITSVNPFVLETFKKQFGGSVHIVCEQKENRKTLYKYTARKQNTINIIHNIYPYLVEKQEQCEITNKFSYEHDENIKDELIHRMKLIKDIGNLVSKYHKKEFEKIRNIIEPIETNYAYLAGFVDAECSLNVQKYKVKNKPNFLYKILLQCNNTRSPVFKWLIERFGGQIHFIDRRNHGKARKNQLTWRLSGKSLYPILNNIYPFLKHKKPVCKQLIKFYQTTLPNGGARHTESFRKQYENVLKIREEIVDKVHKLNSKGIKST